MGDAISKEASAPELLTARLRLRGPRAADLPEMSAMWADPKIARHISGQPSSPSESWSRLLRYIGHWYAMGFGYWAVEDRGTGEFLGEVGLADYKREMQPPLEAPEIGWVLKRAAHGRGIATEAAAAAVAWADRSLTVDRTVCIFAPDHAASLHVAAKLGYKEKGMAIFRDRPTLVMERPKGG